MTSDVTISIVLPIYKNEPIIVELYKKLVFVLSRFSSNFELIFVNDASPDNAETIIKTLSENDHRIKLINHSKNLGQHRAIFSGLRVTKYKFVVVMDADLQDDPAEIPKLLNELESKNLDAVFSGRKGIYQSISRMFFSKIFKWIVHKIAHVPIDAGAFVIMRQEVVKKLLVFKNPGRNFIAPMIGFSCSRIGSLPAIRNKRFIGASSYTTWMRLSLGINVIFDVIRWRLQSE